MDTTAHVHILGCGGAAGIGLTRCLQGDPRWKLTGWDDNPWARKLAECELDPGTDADLILPVPDSLVRLWSGMPHTYLPPPDVVERCQEKELAAKIFGCHAPVTYWVRDTHGAGGAGAAKLTGKMCSEYLPGRNISVELLYEHGHLRASFTKERLSYKVTSVEPNVAGVGSSAVSRCIRDKPAEDVARWAVAAIGKMPHGIYSVDLKEDKYGLPKITEINPGRFLTASYVYFLRANYNLPRLFVEIALGLNRTPLGEYPEGIAIVRQIDRLPWVGYLPRYDDEQIDWEMSDHAKVPG